ncbi:putative pre-mRNA-processing protein 40A-like isoform X2 [Capsicum annuum]|nr:putative pre-mRNA-processing protein 40A-like isoform X2 [Capsicum annuum]
MLKRKGRHIDRELANLLQDKRLDPNFAVMLKENGLDPMSLALLQRSSLDADQEYRESNPPITDLNNVEDVLPNHISFSEELRLQGLGKWLQRCRVMLHHVAETPERAWLIFSLIFILETVVVAIFRPKTIKLLNATHQKVDAQRRHLSVRAHRWKLCLPTWGFGTRLSDLVYFTLCHSQIRNMIDRGVSGLHGSKCSSRPGPRYYYNKVTRTSKWRMPDEVKLAREKDTISYTSDFGFIFVVKTSSLGVDGSLVSAHGAKSSPIAVSPAANLPTIVASESSSLSGKVSSSMIETVEMKNSSEPASLAVTNLEKIGIAVTLGNSVASLVSETTTTQDVVMYGDGFSSENREKDATITEIGGATPSDEKTVELGPLVYESKVAMRAVINDRRYGALKSLCERKQAFNEYLSQKKKLEAEERRVKQKKAREDFRIMLEDCKELSPSSRWSKAISIFEHDERFKAVERAKDHEEIFEDYVEELDKKIKDFAAYLAVSSNTSGSTAKDLFTDVMDELEKQTLVIMVVMVFEEYVEVDDELVVVSNVWKLMMCWWLLVVVLVLINELVGSRDRPVAVNGGAVGGRGVHGPIWYLDDKSQIKDTVRMAEIGLTLSWTLDDFKVAISKYISSPPMSDTNLKFVFEELLERSREKEEKEAKKRKRVADEFYELLHASKMNPPKFYGSKFDEDPRLFLEEVRKITQVVAWRKGRGEGVVPTTWQEFQDAFLDKFLPLDMREAKVEEFMNLRQGSMTIREYYLKFNQLAKYALDLVADNRASMSKFVTGVSS